MRTVRTGEPTLHTSTSLSLLKSVPQQICTKRRVPQVYFSVRLAACSVMVHWLLYSLFPAGGGLVSQFNRGIGRQDISIGAK